MYRTTGKHRYLELASQAVALRDSVKDGLDDNQDRIPVKQHEKIVGHAVRANYLYAGIADLCAEREETEYRVVLAKVWRNLVDKKLYLTGGCGALYNGASPYGNFFTDQKIHQAYGYEYQLPNITAYNETCASLGGVFWAYRMFLLNPKAEYFDIIERMMLNTNLAAVSLDGKRFFYENMLRRVKKLDYELIWPMTRSEYILSYCCPPNLARTIVQSSEYVYTVSDHEVWTGLYGCCEGRFSLQNGAVFTLKQDTEYPFDGRIRFTCENVERNLPVVLQLRIPGWARKGYIRINGVTEELRPEMAGTYQAVEVMNPVSDEVELYLNMEVRHTVAHTMVEENTNQAALERGPLVYCCETPDTASETLDDLLLDLSAEFTEEEIEIAGRKVRALSAEEYCFIRSDYDRNALYQTIRSVKMRRERVRFIPYYAWDNREYGEMRIWFPIACHARKE